jgi:hypothetical protein
MILVILGGYIFLKVVLHEIDNEVIESHGRFKVQVLCNECGEKFIMRAIYGRNGKVETSFKMCICGNTSNITISRLGSIRNNIV